MGAADERTSVLRTVRSMNYADPFNETAGQRVPTTTARVAAIEALRKPPTGRLVGEGPPGPLAGMRTGTWLDDQDFPSLSFAVPGMIPEGLTLFAGPPKAGKSILLQGTALAVASGGLALGSIPVGPARPVLLLALEDGERRLQQRCRALLPKGQAIPQLFNYLIRIQPDTTVLATISAWLEAEKGDKPLIILDTLGRVMPRIAAGQSAYGHEYRLMSVLKNLIDQRRGGSLVVVHHDRKAGADDFVDSVSGTHALAGASDTVIVLARQRHQSQGVLQVTGRDVTEAEYAVDFKDGVWSLVGGNPNTSVRAATARRDTAPLGDRSTDVYTEVSKHHPNSVRRGVIAEALGLEPDTVSVYLGRLVDTGRIQRVRRGVYAALSIPPVGCVGSVGKGEGADPVPNTTNADNGDTAGFDVGAETPLTLPTQRTGAPRVANKEEDQTA